MGVKLVLWHLRRNKTEGVWEQGAEGNVWAQEGGSDGRVEKTARPGASWFVLLAKSDVNDQLTEHEMDRACSTNGVEKERVYSIGGIARGKETTGKTKT
jgi:hypothetical protein